MKVLIDIPEDAESKYIYNSIINKHHIVNDVEIYEQRGLLVRAVRSGIILDGLANGEVHQKVFTSLKPKVGAKNLEVYFYSDAECVGACDVDWWNRKWGE